MHMYYVRFAAVLVHIRGLFPTKIVDILYIKTFSKHTGFYQTDASVLKLLVIDEVTPRTTQRLVSNILEAEMGRTQILARYSMDTFMMV